MSRVIAIVLLTWVAFGRVHQIWHLYLKGVPVKMYRQVFWNNRFEILQSGYLGYLTPYFHGKWQKTKPRSREMNPGNNVRQLNKAVNE